jgi:hypothetical protein
VQEFEVQQFPKERDRIHNQGKFEKETVHRDGTSSYMQFDMQFELLRSISADVMDD